MWGDAGVANDDPRYVGFDKQYQENPVFYKTRLNPVFDLVLRNSGTGSAVLTDIEVKVIKADLAAQGDGIDSRSGTLSSLARYRIEFRPGECCEMSTLDPPLSIQPNDPARFQVEFVPEEGARSIYVLSLVLWFSDDESLETEPFIIEM